jgi:predicted ribosome quality control (RQC) complex YloA/Tae2 family protein
MDFDVLNRVVDELAVLLIGARVERVLQGKEDRGLYLLLRRNRENSTLLLSPERRMPRMHLVSKKPRSSDEPHPLVLNLRSRLIGSRVMQVAMLNQDRVVEIRFVRDSIAYSLIFELTGTSTNLVFTDAEHRILGVYHHVSASDHSSRLLLPGSRYLPPRKKEQALAPQRIPSMDAAYPPNKAAEAYYERLVEQQRIASLSSEIRSSFKKAIVRAERRHAALSDDLRTAQEAEDFRKKGDLVLANLQQLKTGMEYADLVGYDGVCTLVTLDPRRTPSQNAELYFRKYKKARTGYPLIRDRLDRTKEEISFLRSQRAELEDAATLETLLGLRANLLDRGYADQGRKGNRKAAIAPEAGFRKINFQGWEIYVGKSASGNDHITQKLAHPDDLWLHAEGLPGSHVLVRNPQKSDIPQDILLYAASLAALHSKGKNSVKVPVTYTRARFVSKPKGAKPGLVVLSQRKTMMVNPGHNERK